jgi:hypothetical protein
MPADPLAGETRQAIRALRRMPDELRKALRSQVRDTIAAPLATLVAARRPGRQAAGITVKAVGDLEPAIRVGGGASPVYQHRAQGRQLFYGIEFGGGVSRTWIAARSPRGRHYSYRRRVTAQFVPAHPFVMPTFAANRDRISDEWVAVLDPFLTAWASGG